MRKITVHDVDLDDYRPPKQTTYTKTTKAYWSKKEYTRVATLRPSGLLTNVEFILLYLMKNGPSTQYILRNALAKWRGKKDWSKHQYNDYFQAQRGGNLAYRGFRPDSDRLWWKPRNSRGPFMLTGKGAYRAGSAFGKIVTHLNEGVRDGSVKE